MHGKMKTVCNISFRNSEGKKSLWRLMKRWENNIKMELREIWCKGLDWIHLSLDRIQQ
jgi:hypothetical protein